MTYDEKKAKEDEFVNKIITIIILGLIILIPLVWIGAEILNYNLKLNFCRTLIQEAAANGLSVLPGAIYDVVKEIVN